MADKKDQAKQGADAAMGQGSGFTDYMARQGERYAESQKNSAESWARQSRNGADIMAGRAPENRGMRAEPAGE